MSYIELLPRNEFSNFIVIQRTFINFQHALGFLPFKLQAYVCQLQFFASTGHTSFSRGWLNKYS